MRQSALFARSVWVLRKNLCVGRARARGRGEARTRTSWYPLSSGLHAHDPVRVHPVAESCSGPEHGLSGPPRRFLVPSTAAPRGASVPSPARAWIDSGACSPRTRLRPCSPLASVDLPSFATQPTANRGRRLPSVPNTAMIASSRPATFTLLASSSHVESPTIRARGFGTEPYPPSASTKLTPRPACTPPRGNALEVDATSIVRAPLGVRRDATLQSC